MSILPVIGKRTTDIGFKTQENFRTLRPTFLKICKNLRYGFGFQMVTIICHFAIFLQIEKELTTYSDHSNISFKHTWYKDEGKLDTVYFHAPSFAVDANTTFSVIIAAVILKPY